MIVIPHVVLKTGALPEHADVRLSEDGPLEPSEAGTRGVCGYRAPAGPPVIARRSRAAWAARLRHIMRWPFLPAEHTVLDATLTSAALHVTLLDRRRVWTRLAGIWTRPDVLNVRGLDVYQVGAFDWLWFPRPTCEVVRALDAHLRERAT